MAQTGYTPLLIYSSSTVSQAPSAGNLTNSTLGSELAINITDGKLFYKDNVNAVQVIAWKTTPTTAGGTGLTSYTAGDLLYYATGTALSKLAIGASGYWLGSSSTAPQWNAPAALTKTDDTNVTLTLGGSASTALLNAASLTLGWTGQLAVTRGGTGLSSVAQGDILYGSAANTLSALAKNTTASRYLSNSGTSNNPAWAQVNLSDGVTGTLPTGNGGTGLTSFTSTGVLYASSTSALSTSSNFTFDGTDVYVANILSLGGSPISATKLDVYQDLGGIGDAAYFKDTGSGYGAGAVYIRFVNNAGSTAGKIEHTASTTVNYNTASDQRLKIDKGVATDISVIDNTIIHDYEWIEDGRIDRGVFAQEALKIKPSAISVGDDKTNQDGVLMNPWGVDYSKYVPDLIVYCQQLKAEMSSLKSKLKDAGIVGF